MSHQRFEVEPGIELNIAIDDCTDPWSSAETILMVHGLAESGEAWRGWVPHLSRHYRVARVDLRGFGRSTPMPANHPWNMERLLGDLTAVIKYLGCRKVHLIGAKSGGSMVLTMAARKPELVQSVIAVTPPVIAAAGTTDWLVQIEAEGIQAWATTTMAGRLGSKASAAEVDYWIHNIQGKTPLSTLQGYLRWVPGLDIREEVLQIQCPSLIITTTGSGLRTVDSVKAWQQKLAQSELMVIDGDAWHAAGAYPDVCGKAAAAFLAKRTVPLAH